MKPVLQFLRTTIVGGILFLVPIVVLAILLEKALALAHKFVEPLAERIPVHSVIGLKTPMFLAIGLIVLFCFLAGFLARSSLAQKVVGGLETGLLSNLPGYEFLKRIGESLLGVEREGAYPPVLVRLGDAWQFGFQIEEPKAGVAAVFVPGAPNANSGQIFLLSPDRVQPVGVPPAKMLKCLQRLGAGSGALLTGLRTEAATAQHAGSQPDSGKTSPTS